MWFKNPKENENLIEPAKEVWPVLTKYFKDRGRSIGKITFSAIHFRYSISVKNVGHGLKLPKKPEGLRILASDSDGPLALQDLSLNKKKPMLFSTRLEAGIINDFIEARNRLKHSGIKEDQGEIRLVSILELNLEAIWYRSEDGTRNDFFAKKQGFTELESMDEQAFNSYLNQLKFQRQKTLEFIKDQKDKEPGRPIAG